MLLLASTATPPLQTFTQGPLRLLDVRARPTASQGLRVVDASCAPNFTTTARPRRRLRQLHRPRRLDSELESEPRMGPCETLLLGAVQPTVDDAWQYWMKKPTRFVPTAAANVDFVPYFELDDEQMTVYPCYAL